jgi:hypothetical protein
VKREVLYDRETRDYALYLDGQIVGYARTRHEGDARLNAIVYQRMASEGRKILAEITKE